MGPMRINQYHLLQFIPATQAWEMPPALEQAAQALVASGKLRINADTERNFVRHGTSDDDLTFTARELTDPNLVPRTRARLAKLVPPAQDRDGIEALHQRLLSDLKKARGVAPEKEAMVARVIAQSCHPVVMQLLLESGAELFVSYSHNVGDLMAVHEWQGHGQASGLQSTADKGQQVFISAGGDPFFAGDEKTYVTDGFPALARMVVIGGQELGHFADLARTASGAITGRYSMSDGARAARRADMANLQQWAWPKHRAFTRLYRTEQGLAFYDRRGKYSPVWWGWKLRQAYAWLRFSGLALPGGLPRRLSIHPPQRTAHALATFLDDMVFNLAPDADVYRHPDPFVEEQIACIEATARVPQQVNKWGHEAVKAAWPNLYRLYYGTIIAQCRSVLRQAPPSLSMSLWQQVTILLRRRFRKRPDHYPE